MSTQTLENNQVTAGGWSTYHALTPEDKAVFDAASKGLIGVVYAPNSVSTQVVAGTNYRFKCNATIPPAEVIWEAIVEVFQPLNGQPYITGIVRI